MRRELTGVDWTVLDSGLEVTTEKGLIYANDTYGSTALCKLNYGICKFTFFPRHFDCQLIALPWWSSIGEGGCETDGNWKR